MGLRVAGPLSSLVLFFMEPTAPFRHVHSHQQGSSPLTFANCFMAFKDFHLQRKEREGGNRGRKDQSSAAWGKQVTMFFFHNVWGLSGF